MEQSADDNSAQTAGEQLPQSQDVEREGQSTSSGYRQASVQPERAFRVESSFDSASQGDRDSRLSDPDYVEIDDDQRTEISAPPSRGEPGPSSATREAVDVVDRLLDPRFLQRGHSMENAIRDVYTTTSDLGVRTSQSSITTAEADDEATDPPPRRRDARLNANYDWGRNLQRFYTASFSRPYLALFVCPDPTGRPDRFGCLICGVSLSHREYGVTAATKHFKGDLHYARELTYRRQLEATIFSQAQVPVVLSRDEDLADV